MKKYIIHLLIIVLLANIILPNYVSAVETDTHSQYTAFSDRQAVQIGLEKYVGSTRSLVIMFALDNEDYWMKSREERARIINNYKKNDPGYTYVDLLAKSDVTPSKQATTISPDVDFWFNQVLGLKLPKDVSVYDGINSQIKELFGFHPSSLNDPVYRDNPVFFGDDMREYFDKNGKDKPKTTIFEKEALDWLYSPEGYLSNYFENRNNPSFTEAEVKVLMQPQGYNSDEFFKQLDFILNTTSVGSLATGQVEITLGVVLFKSAIKFRALFSPLRKLIPKSILSWFKFLEPSLPEIATDLAKQKYILRNGKNVTERAISVGESKIGEFPSVVKALSSDVLSEEEQINKMMLDMYRRNEAGMRQFDASKTESQVIENWGNLKKPTDPDKIISAAPKIGDVIGIYSKEERDKIVGEVGVETFMKLERNLMRIRLGYDYDILKTFSYPNESVTVMNKFVKSIFQKGSQLKIVHPDDIRLFDPIAKKQVAVRTIEENGQPIVIFSSNPQGRNDLVAIKTEMYKIYEKDLEPLRQFSKFDNDSVMEESAIRYLARRDVKEEFQDDNNQKIISVLINSHYNATDPSLKTKIDYTADLWDRLNQSIVHGIIKKNPKLSLIEVQDIVDRLFDEILYVSGTDGLVKRVFFDQPGAVGIFRQRIKAWDDAISLGNMTSTIKSKLKLEDDKFFKSVKDIISDSSISGGIKDINSYKEYYGYQQIWKKEFRDFSTPTPLGN